MEGIGITNAVAITVDGKVELEDYRVYNKDKDKKKKKFLKQKMESLST